MYIEIPFSESHKSSLWQHRHEQEIQKEISYILNECCSKLENYGVSVFYKMKDSNNKEIHLEIP